MKTIYNMYIYPNAIAIPKGQKICGTYFCDFKIFSYISFVFFS